ncbi:carotenoid biosynthesis protein [Paenibacillus wynnii]|uniref:Carotenoid biosynthesis protein n=1 Tax=Paenibacillus wynnii TaxID=268407 RepID=A0A098ME71_9BACL|nr:carotenoid biosynthesis protein [Paenibacillus wynnii]KGE20351.1 hypothetical protein PWYN_14150 [Paenibacillus wynnii]
MIRVLFWGWYFIGALLLIIFSLPESLQFSNGLFLVFYAVYAMKLIKDGLELHIMSDQSVIISSHAPLGLSAVLVWTGGMSVEWIGVHSGRLFGVYEYSDILGPLLFGVPVTLGFAWIAVVSSAVLISREFGLSGHLLSLARALQVGLWTVIMDLVLDPVAHAKGYWHWSAGGGLYGVPWQNFIGWFIVGAILSLLFWGVKVTRSAARRGTRLYQAILILFGLLGLREGLPICTVIAALGAILAEGSLRNARSHQTQKL